MGRVDRRAATERIARLVVTEVELTARPLAQTAGNALRDDVDDTADGAAALEQGGGPLQHFDLVGDQRIDTDRMIVTQGRCVHRRLCHLPEYARAHRPDHGSKAG